MPSTVMDRKHMSLHHRLPVDTASSLFHDELCLHPSERQVEFWKPGSLPDQVDLDSLSFMSGSKHLGYSSKLQAIGPKQHKTVDSDVKGDGEQLFFGARKCTVAVPWGAIEQDRGSRLGLSAKTATQFSDGRISAVGWTPYENGHFSSSLSEILDSQLRIAPKSSYASQPNDEKVKSDEPFELTDEIESRTIGDLLPDDEELFSSAFDDMASIRQLNHGDDMEDDIFCTGGGMELDADDSIVNGGINGRLLINSHFVGEHPAGEHPSRTLFVRNINSNVGDSELRSLFEKYGEIKTMYTACKHRGFVMISYYDIRAARDAMNALQNKPLKRRKLDIHYSIPKDNPSEEDINQGTLVIFNVDPSVANDELHKIFDVYGEIKEIRESSQNLHSKLIEFFDTRAAEAALRASHRIEIAGKKIRLEPSLMQQRGLEPQQEKLGGYGAGLLTDTGYLPFSSSVPQILSSSVGMISANHLVNSDVGYSSIGHANLGVQGSGNFHPHSLPEHRHAMSHLNPMGMDGGLPYKAVQHPYKVGLGSFGTQAFNCNDAFDASEKGSQPLQRQQFMWSNSSSFHQQHSPSMLWTNSPPFVNNVPSLPLQGIVRPPPRMLDNAVPLNHHHHVGSAPTVDPTLWDRCRSYVGDVPNGFSFHPGSVGSMGFSGNAQMNSLFSQGGRNFVDPVVSPSLIGIPSQQRTGNMFHGRNSSVTMLSPFDAPSGERSRSRRTDTSSNQTENKKQYELDIERIMQGEDSRTTLMIKNIPNKYTSKMLLAAIDENHRGTYDFIYLPIDFKNKCNVGYAFINMISPQNIIPFYKTFDGKKWEKFNSEKVATLAYARIQGKAALIAHFQNSSLMNEDKRCRPILFHTDGPNAGDQEPFPMGSNVRSRSGRSRASSGTEETAEIPSIFGTLNETSSGSNKDLE